MMGVLQIDAGMLPSSPPWMLASCAPGDDAWSQRPPHRGRLRLAAPLRNPIPCFCRLLTVTQGSSTAPTWRDSPPPRSSAKLRQTGRKPPTTRPRKEAKKATMAVTTRMWTAALPPSTRRRTSFALRPPPHPSAALPLAQ